MGLEPTTPRSGVACSSDSHPGAPGCKHFKVPDKY